MMKISKNNKRTCIVARQRYWEATVKISSVYVLWSPSTIVARFEKCSFENTLLKL